MREEDIIKQTKIPNTLDSILRDLRLNGVNEGDHVLVHSSLSSMGWVCGGPQTVIMALLQAVGNNGTIIMPAQSGDWSDPAKWSNPPVPNEWIQVIYDHMPAFDPKLTPTRGMGRVSELFRTYPDTIRSNHPHVSFCANGKYAKEITNEHVLTPQFGFHSPLGKMYHLNVKVLLIGVDYDSCTSFHLAETLVENMPMSEKGTAITKNGIRVWKWFEDYEYDSDDFTLLGKDFELSNHVNNFKIGHADCKIFDLKIGVEFAVNWLMKNRLGIK
ncbi:MAG: Aminoglycoside N(3)-acetyltransferase [Haloplasmataceae bacterium]|jgi:aminoglycoside 3-N-acetyltransferase|nr:Aminoglycoside N(3)-acetyltransferase [Haloplasmataceae bacterium]